MNFLKVGADVFARSSAKTKAIIISAAAGMFMFVFILLPMSPAIAAASLIAKVAGEITEFAQNTMNYLETTGDMLDNLFKGRGFTVINEEKVKKQEDKVRAKFKEKYDYFSGHVQLDLPLIAATIYYPMNFVYDEKTIEGLNNMDGKTEEQIAEDQEEQYEFLYDYYKKVRRDPKSYITELANHSISETEITYKCNSSTTTNSDGEEVTSYFPGEQIDTTGPQEFLGTFKDNEICEEGVDSIKVYVYQNDPDRYDKYLKEEHIFSNKAYDSLFKDLDSTAQMDKLDNVVDEIYSLKGLYADILGVHVKIGQYSNLCTNGVVVSGTEGGIYSLEEYVAGVVDAENDWYEGDNIESMKAQAIAARTYALYVTNMCQNPIGSSSSTQNFDPNPSSITKKAASETAGMIMTYDGKIFKSEYDSFYCTEVTTCIAGIDCSCEYTEEPNGEKHIVTASYDFAQKGLGGHGRGMSQIVANYLQTKGYDYKRILEYFYSPGVVISQSSDVENGTDGMVTVSNGTYYIPADMDSGKEGPYSSGEAGKGLNIFFWNRLQSFFAAAKSNGYDVWVNYGWRSYDDQERVAIERPDYAAEPGKSLHGWGIAADLGFGNQGAKDWAHTHAAEFLLDFAACKNYWGGDSECHEDWHIQPTKIIEK